MLEGFLFYYNFVSANSCGICEEGRHSEFRRPFPLLALLPSGYGERAVASSRFRRAFAEGEQLVSLPSSTEVLHATAKRAQRRGFLGGACGLRNFELAPPKGFLSLQTETKLQLKSTIKNILQSSYIKNDNPH